MGGVSPSSPALLQIKSQPFCMEQRQAEKRAVKTQQSLETAAAAATGFIRRGGGGNNGGEASEPRSPARGTWQLSWGRGLSPHQTLMLSALLQPIIKDQNSAAPLARMRPGEPFRGSTFRRSCVAFVLASGGVPAPFMLPPLCCCFCEHSQEVVTSDLCLPSGWRAQRALSAASCSELRGIEPRPCSHCDLTQANVLPRAAVTSTCSAVVLLKVTSSVLHPFKGTCAHSHTLTCEANWLVKLLIQSEPQQSNIRAQT